MGAKKDKNANFTVSNTWFALFCLLVWSDEVSLYIVCIDCIAEVVAASNHTMLNLIPFSGLDSDFVSFLS